MEICTSLTHVMIAPIFDINDSGEGRGKREEGGWRREEGGGRRGDDEMRRDRYRNRINPFAALQYPQ